MSKKHSRVNSQKLQSLFKSLCEGMLHQGIPAKDLNSLSQSHGFGPTSQVTKNLRKFSSRYFGAAFFTDNGDMRLIPTSETQEINFEDMDDKFRNFLNTGKLEPDSEVEEPSPIKVTPMESSMREQGSQEVINILQVVFIIRENLIHEVQVMGWELLSSDDQTPIYKVRFPSGETEQMFRTDFAVTKEELINKLLNAVNKI